MRKKFWLQVDKFDKKIITTAIESWVEAILADDEIYQQIKELALIDVISPKWDIKLGKDVNIVQITKKQDEDKAVKLAKKAWVIIQNNDRTIIPLENLISKTNNIIQTVSDESQAQVALQSLEKWSDGILLTTKDMNTIKKTGEIVNKMNTPKMDLVEAEIISTKHLGMANRCCVDTANMLDPGTGLLVGDISSNLLLVHNENVHSPYCDPRPFRVNAGAVHAYVMCPDNKTKYLWELKSGDEVLIIDSKWNTSIATVGRNKIEKRPMLLVKASYKNQVFTLIMQNAETIRLIDPKGKPLSVTKMKKWDKVMAYITKWGRHFGQSINETICEI